MTARFAALSGAAAAAIVVALLAGCASTPAPELVVPSTGEAATPPDAQQSSGSSAPDRARAELTRRGIDLSILEFTNRCLAGDDDAVALFLEAGYPATTKGYRGTVLADALGGKSAAVVKRLLAAGADPNAVEDEYGTTVLQRRSSAFSSPPAPRAGRTSTRSRRSCRPPSKGSSRWSGSWSTPARR